MATNQTSTYCVGSSRTRSMSAMAAAATDSSALSSTNVVREETMAWEQTRCLIPSNGQTLAVPDVSSLEDWWDSMTSRA